MRDFTAEINTGTTAVPVWVEILGLQDGPAHKPSSKTKDVATYASAGREDERVVTRGDKFALKGERLESSTGTRDPGQEAVEAAGDLMGYASAKQYRLTSPGGVTLTFEATAEVTQFGGGKEEFAEWSVDLTVCGTIS
jgi:hypothetical protein